MVAQEQGTGFREPLAFVGPFPSGAPAIFIDQVARLGQACAIIGCVGDDDFGWVNLERLTRDGVDVAAIEVLPGHATGSAFVRYREDGGRDFLFNTKDSACGQISLTKAGLALLDECSHVHISGASLFSNRVIDVVSEAVALVKRNGGSVSFDPNVRKEVMGDREVFAALKTILSTCDTFLPSGDELTVLTDATTPDEAVREILALGVSEIVVKQGADGAAHYSREGRVERPAYLVQEVDPTGAGDCFDAAFITCRLQGRGVEESLDYANAAGARAVTVRGPMEGTSDFAQLDAVRSARRSTVGARPRIAGWLLRGAAGITSVCSAQPLVLEAAMLEAASRGTPALIEATCNQVNHTGGYTGMTPADFVNLVQDVAGAISFPCTEIVLGGDHLGPSPWRHLAAEEAMAQAEAMVAAYVGAGFEKIHLDTSMGCKGEPDCIPSELAAARAAQLAVVAEMAGAATNTDLRYVVGTEVPTPGGAKEEIERLEVTRPDAVIETVAEHRRAFAEAGATSASESIVAVVVQPGDRVRRPEGGRLPAGAGGASPNGARRAAGARLRGPLDGLPAAGRARTARAGRVRDPQGRTRTHFRLSPSALRARPGRRGARPKLGCALARDRDGGGDARRPPALAVALPRRRRAGTMASPLRLQRSRPLLLALSGLSPSGGAAAEPPRREEHPVEPRRGVLPGSSRPRRERESRPAAEEPAAGNRSRRAPVLRGSLRRRLIARVQENVCGERFLSDRATGREGIEQGVLR